MTKFLNIYAMGGIEEIGANCTAYWNDDLCFFVDYGICLQNIDDITPYNGYYMDLVPFLKKINQKTINIVITHCHEDHVGGIAYIHNQIKELKANNININIYVSSTFNQKVVIGKCHKSLNEIKINIINASNNQYFYIGNVKLKFLKVDHSALECNGVLIEYQNKKIFHTGDWRFKYLIKNLDQLSNSDTYQTMLKIKKCDIIVGESTKFNDINVANTEQDVENELSKIIQDLSKKQIDIIITMFSSNMIRLKNIIKIAIKYEQKISYMSYTLKNYISISNQTNQFTSQEYSVLKHENSIEKLLKSKNKIKIVSGCQNEYNSTLNKIAYNPKNAQFIKKGTTVIFSATAIPSSKKRIEHLHRKLDDCGINVIDSDSNNFVHTSGHALPSDMYFMYKKLEPKYLIPIHGNILKIKSHVKLAQSLQIQPLMPKKNKYIQFIFQENNLTHKEFIIYFPIKKKYILDRKTFNEEDPVIQERKNLIVGGAIFICKATNIIHCIGAKIGYKDTQTILLCLKNNKDANYIKTTIGFQGEIIISEN
ncbi:Ribonuclease J1 [bacterium AB1]|nr:Ribonuclease J1 [bacterium AB1]